MKSIFNWLWQLQLIPKELKLLGIVGDDLQKTPKSYSITTLAPQPGPWLKVRAPAAYGGSFCCFYSSWFHME